MGINRSRRGRFARLAPPRGNTRQAAGAPRVAARRSPARRGSHHAVRRQTASRRRHRCPRVLACRPVATEAEPTTQVHGGRLIAARLKAYGVTKLFTLSGGHLFSIYDGCRAEGIDIVDVRHEQSAAFAAEGWAKVTRTPGVCALTAGPGVTNGMSAIASARQNNSPILVLGGRAPQFRWGQGSLQEIDHVPFVRPLVKLAATAGDTAEIPALIDEAMRTAIAPHSGPAFLDFPLDYVFGEADGPAPAGAVARGVGRRRRRPSRDRSGRRAAARGGAAGDHGGRGPVLGSRRARTGRAGRGAPDPRVRQRPGPRVHPRRPRAGLLARAPDRPAGRGRRAGHRRAARLPARVRRIVRCRRGDRGDRRGRGRAGATALARRRAVRRAPGHARHAARSSAPARTTVGPTTMARRPARHRGRRARRRGGRAGRRARAAAPDAGVWRAASRCSIGTRS